MNYSISKIEEVECLLSKISEGMKKVGKETLQKTPITLPQYVALQYLHEFGKMTIGELSNKIHLAFSSTTDLIDRLEKQQLVKRIRSKKDKRVVYIYLSENGKSMVNQVLEARKKHLSTLFYDIEEDKMVEMAEVLKVFVDTLEKE